MTSRNTIGRMVMSAPDQNGELSSFSKVTRTPLSTSVFGDFLALVRAESDLLLLRAVLGRIDDR
jgi:hypothetical protein